MKILVADDEEVFREIVVGFLKKEKYEIVEASNGKEALMKYQSDSSIDLCILDVMMSEMNGIEVCKRIKSSPNPSPVLILTAKDSDEDQIEALEAGADDYISKPFNFPILMLRVKSLLRRNDKTETIDFNGVSVNISKHEVIKDGSRLELTPKEFELLVYLLKNKGTVLSRDSILSKVWGYDYFGDNRTVDTHIKNLRAKVGDNLIKTVRGYGYVIE